MNLSFLRRAHRRATPPTRAGVVLTGEGPVAPASETLPPMNLSNAQKLLYHRRLCEMVRTVDGDFVECGVGEGRTFLLLACLVFSEGRGRNLWGFDSFEGFPEPTAEDESCRCPRKGEWAGTSLKDVHNMLKNAGFSSEWLRSTVTLVKGFFNQSLRDYTGNRIALLHIDVDLYQSYRDVLEHLYDLVAPNGIIAFDEYMGTFENYSFPGAKRAIDEFFVPKQIEILRDESIGKYYVVKPVT